MSLYTIQALLILSSEGDRLLAKYYSPPHGVSSNIPPLKAQQKFEKDLAAKTNRINGDIIIVDGRLVVYKQMADSLLYVVSSPDENEAMMYQTLVALRDALEVLLDRGIDKQAILENYDRVALAVDETVDSGIILESDGQVIASRVTRKASDEPSLQNIDLSEKGLRNMFDFAKGKLTQAVRQQFA